MLSGHPGEPRASRSLCPPVAGSSRTLRRGGAFVILAILLASAALRLTGLRHGEPQWIFHPDVSKQVHVAMNIFSGKRNPVFYGEEDFQRRLYPYGTAVLLGTALRSAERAGVVSIDRGSFPENTRWLWSVRFRLFSVVLSLFAITVLLVFLSARIPPGALLLTGALLALDPLSVRYSHYGMNDVPLIAILLLAWLSSWKMACREGLHPFFTPLTGLLLGIGFGVKYQAVLGLLFPAAAMLPLLKKGRASAAVLSSVLLLGGFIAGAAAVSPVLRGDPLGFPSDLLRFMSWQADILGGQLPVSGKVSRNLAWIGRFSVQSGTILLLPGILWAAGRLFLRRHEGCERYLLLATLLFPLALAGLLVATRDIMRENDVMYAVPFLVMLTGFMLGGVHGRRRRLLLMGGAACLAVIFGVVSLRDSLAFARPDTRLAARQWCRERIGEGSVVLRDRYALPVDKEGVFEERFRFLVQPPASRKISAGEFDYLVSTSLSLERFFDPLSPFHSLDAQEVFREMEDTLPVLAVFRDRPLPFNQPTVTVYGNSSRGGGTGPAPQGQR